MVYLFNPENDLALANFSSNYTPPASAVRMGKELALLPIWYADGESPKVIAEGEENVAFLNRMKEVFDLRVSLLPLVDIAAYPNEPIVPWGWNPSLVRRLQAYGANENQLLSNEELERLRGYSHRKHAVEVLVELRKLDEHFIGESRIFRAVEEVLDYLESMPGDKALKMPLSGSGKGLIWILSGITDKQVDWCRRLIRDQGGVVAEPKYRRLRDFAMEFFLDKGKIRFAGYSLFRTADSGAYVGNELLTDARIEYELSPYVPLAVLTGLKERLLEELPSRFPHYQGYAGVDMMVCETEEGNKIHPCVEINMRMNMGVVSRIIYDRFVHECLSHEYIAHDRIVRDPTARECSSQDGTFKGEREGLFKVDYFKKPEEALLFHHHMEREYPLVVKENKVASGYLPLTPVTAETRYTAYIVVR